MTEPEQQTTAANEDVYLLDDAIVKLLEEYRLQASIVGAQESGALTLFVRQHDLKGRWQLAENRRELVRTPEGQA
jgi:sulfur transfer complex TusBCD TusB component (DsrH family)